MARVLAISSQTVFGPVGLTASVPALQALGHEVLTLPTITLSHHPGHGPPDGQRTPASLMQKMLEGLKRIGALENLDAVLTGYFADAEQVAVIAETLPSLACPHILVDPVIGDHGALYVPEAVAIAIRDHLLPRATITTPNQFELQWLAREQDIAAAVRKLCRTETLVTSVGIDPTHLATQLYAGTDVQEHTTMRRAHVPHGTGDFLAGLYLGHRLHENPATAFTKAMAGMEHVITASAGSPRLKVEAITADHQRGD
jgi:pyridoxine kinase